MKHFFVFCGAALLLLSLTCSVFAEAPAPVRSEQSGSMFTLNNGLIAIRFDAASGTLTATSGQTVIFRDIQFGKGQTKAEIAPQKNLLGEGSAIVLSKSDRSASR